MALTTKTYYTYLWLRQDGTPYYVGKGTGKRGFVSFNHGVKCPRDHSRIIAQEQSSEEAAFAVEKFLITYYGRLDLGTGCLRNLTGGGENPPKVVWTAERREVARQRQLGNTYRRGSHQSPEANQKNREAHQGFHHSSEAKKKISNAAKIYMIGNQNGRKKNLDGTHD